MDERYSRVALHDSLYQSNDDHKFVMFFYYLIFPLVIILSLFFLSTINVKATTSIDVTSGITPGQSCSTHPTNKYCSLNTCQTGDAGQVWSFGDTNDSCNVMSIQFYLNTTVGGYTANTLKLTGSNFRNTNYYCTSSVGGCTVVYVSSTQLNVNFQNNSASGINNPQFQINAYNDGFINNGQSWKLTKITYLYNDIGQGQTSTDQVINNQNDNTQQVLDSISSATQTITNAINNAFNNCQVQKLNFSQIYLPSSYTNISYDLNGNQITFVRSNANTGYLAILINDLKPNTDYKLSIGNVSSNYSLISTILRIRSGRDSGDWVTNQFSIESNKTYTFNTGNYTTGWLWVYMLGSNYGQFTISDLKIYDEHYCINTQEEISNNQKETNDLIKDDSIDQSQANSFFNDFEDTDNGGISTIITKPLTIINNLLSNNSSCSALALPDFMGATNVSLPSGCILWDNAPSSVVTIWNIFIVGLGSYWVLKSLFNDIQRLKDPDDDKVEVMDL